MKDNATSSSAMPTIAQGSAARPAGGTMDMGSHVEYERYVVRTAKCDRCESRNPGLMQKCKCGYTVCYLCHEKGDHGSKHANLANLPLDWSVPEKPAKKPLQSSSRSSTALATDAQAVNAPASAMQTMASQPRQPAVASQAPQPRRRYTKRKANNNRDDQAEDDNSVPVAHPRQKRARTSQTGPATEDNTRPSESVAASSASIIPNYSSQGTQVDDDLYAQFRIEPLRFLTQLPSLNTADQSYGPRVQGHGSGQPPRHPLPTLGPVRPSSNAQVKNEPTELLRRGPRLAQTSLATSYHTRGARPTPGTGWDREVDNSDREVIRVHSDTPTSSSSPDQIAEQTSNNHVPPVQSAPFNNTSLPARQSVRAQPVQFQPARTKPAHVSTSERGLTYRQQLDYTWEHDPILARERATNGDDSALSMMNGAMIIANMSRTASSAAQDFVEFGEWLAEKRGPARV